LDGLQTFEADKFELLLFCCQLKLLSYGKFYVAQKSDRLLLQQTGSTSGRASDVKNMAVPASEYMSVVDHERMTFCR